MREQLDAQQKAVADANSKAEAAQAALSEVLAARRGAREALGEMAVQNARLVVGYCAKKAELKRLQEGLAAERARWEVPPLVMLHWAQIALAKNGCFSTPRRTAGVPEKWHCVGMLCPCAQLSLLIIKLFRWAQAQLYDKLQKHFAWCYGRHGWKGSSLECTREQRSILARPTCRHRRMARPQATAARRPPSP